MLLYALDPEEQGVSQNVIFVDQCMENSIRAVELALRLCTELGNVGSVTVPTGA